MYYLIIKIKLYYYLSTHAIIHLKPNFTLKYLLLLSIAKAAFNLLTWPVDKANLLLIKAKFKNFRGGFFGRNLQLIVL